MAAPFAPPSADLPGKPALPIYTPPNPTQLPLNFAKLTTIRLSSLSSPDAAVRDALVATTKKAISEDGFLFLEDYGVSVEQLERQFAIAEFLHAGISEVEKVEEGDVEVDGEKSLLWDPERGSFAGWKRGFGWKVSP